MNSIVTTTILFLLFFGCKERKNYEIDFCKMFELDQSFVNTDIKSENFQSDRLKRHKIIKDNFKELISYSNENGFPEIKTGPLKGVTGLDSCRNWAVNMTLFHVGQTQPILFFEPEVVELFKREIETGRFKNGSLVGPLWQGLSDFRFCEKGKTAMHNALNSWGLEVSDLPEIQFVKCEENSE